MLYFVAGKLRPGLWKSTETSEEPRFFYTPNLGEAMKWLNVNYSVWFNRRYERTGHLQGRYKALLVGDERSWLGQVTDYVHLNPARTKELGLGRRNVRPSLPACCPLPVRGEAEATPTIAVVPAELVSGLCRLCRCANPASDG